MISPAQTDWSKATSSLLNESALRPLVDKWKPLLDGVDDKVTALMLANMDKYFKEKEKEKPKKVKWPTFPPIINNIVSVQPMTHPVGRLLFYEPRYASRGPKLVQGYLFDDTTLQSLPRRG